MQQEQRTRNSRTKQIGNRPRHSLCGLRVAVKQRITGQKQTDMKRNYSTRYLASFEPTPLLPAASALLGRPGIHILDDLREWSPNIRVRLQAILQVSGEVREGLLRLPPLLRGRLHVDVALRGWHSAVPPKSVTPREVVPAAITEMKFLRVRLRGPAMPLELFKVLEICVRADATLDHLDCPTRDVGLRSLEEKPMLWLQFAGYLEILRRLLLLLLLHRAVNMVHRVLFNSPLDPSRLLIRGIHRPTLLETWSRQGLVVNALRTRGREPLRSASRLLGFTICQLLGDPGHRLAAGPSRRLRCLQDPLSCSAASTAPGSFGGWHLLGMIPRRASIV